MDIFGEIWAEAIEAFRKHYSENIIRQHFLDAFIGAVENEYILILSPSDESVKFLRKDSRNIESLLLDVMGSFKLVYVYPAERKRDISQLKEDIEFDIEFPADDDDVYSRPSPRSVLKDDPRYEKSGIENFLKKYGSHRNETFVAKDDITKKYMCEPAEKNINSNYTFDNFIVSNSNRFVYNSCYAVAQNPSDAWNPLFIYGPSGLGKTHMLYAIANEIKRNKPELNLIYIKSEEFTNELVASLKVKDGPAQFRAKFRTLDVLLIDDIQFIGGKEGVQEEFFHTFDTLYENNKQIILTSDKPPREIKTLQDRLLYRFEMGLIADVQPPDYELRAAVIESKAKEYGIELPQDVVTYLSEVLSKNIRQIEGSLKRLAAMNALYGLPVTIEMAKKTIVDIKNMEASPKAIIDKIFSIVAARYEVEVNDLKSKSRRREITVPRNLVIYLIRNNTSYSLNQIANIFNKDHTTVMNSINATKAKISTEPLFERIVFEIEEELK